ncbi:hypothetical protein CL646_03230 [bacterium]|nr:hypothetical protein [bacterium]
MRISYFSKLIIIISFFFISFLTFANANCNFQIGLGENISKIKNLTEIDSEDNLILENYSVPSSYICPDQFKNEKLNINYTFIKDELASIKVTVSNDKNNTISNKLILMNYVKQTYGDFDTGTNPKIYNYFNSWKNGNKIIIYARLKDQFNIINEELFITNEKYKNKMKLINAMIEKGEIKG